MKKVLFLNNWGLSPDYVLELYRYLTPNHDGVWNNIQITTDINNADYFVILDDVSPDFDFDCLNPNKTIFLQREPKDIKPITVNVKMAYRGTYNEHYHCAAWRLKKTFKELLNLRLGDKQKKLSTVTSGKTITLGQKMRLNVVYQLAKELEDIDVYGRGLSKWKLGKKYKGELNYNEYCKFEGLYPYQYSLAMENSQHLNYFTEKVVDCFLTWTKPIYWGCPNISKYFPTGSYSLVDIEASDLAQQVRNIINSPIDYQSIAIARKRIMYDYNLMAVVAKVINQIDPTE